MPFSQLLISNGWMIFIALALVCLYEQGISTIDKEKKQLTTHLKMLEEEKKLALNRQSQLQREMASLEDPEYQKLMLIQSLGIAPKGGRLVFFRNH